MSARQRPAQLLIALSLSLLGAIAWAQLSAQPPAATPRAAVPATEPLQATLAAYRVERDAKGAEQLKPAEQVRPGDLIEYQLSYRNQGAIPLTGLAMDLPIPAGTEWLQGQGNPAPQQASLQAQGGAFQSIPLKRQVRNAQGKLIEERVPVAEYRVLRWQAERLPPQASLTYKARVRVLDNSAAAPATAGNTPAPAAAAPK